MKPKNISLALYHPTKSRLNHMKFPFGVNLTRWINLAICEKMDRDHPETVGVAVVEDEPLSIVTAEAPFDPMAERRRLLRLQQGPKFIGPYLRKYPKGCDIHTLAEDMDKKKGSGSPGMEAIIEDLCIGSGMEMSPEEKGAVLAAHAKAEKELVERAEKERQRQEQEIEELKALQDAPQVNPHAAAEAKFEAMQKANHEKWLAERDDAEKELGLTPLINVAAPTMGDAADFWGDADEAAYHKIKAKACKA